MPVIASMASKIVDRNWFCIRIGTFCNLLLIIVFLWKVLRTFSLKRILASL